VFWGFLIGVVVPTVCSSLLSALILPCLGLYLRLRPCGCSSMVVLPPLPPVEASSLGLNTSLTTRYRLHLCLKIGAVPPSTTDRQIHINSAAVSRWLFRFCFLHLGSDFVVLIYSPATMTKSSFSRLVCCSWPRRPFYNRRFARSSI
jgi:hypothetical protein